MASQESGSEEWSKTAETYNNNIGRSTIYGTEALVELASSILPISSESAVLDNATGTGNVSRTISERCPSAKVTAADFSESMIKAVDAMHLPNVQTQIADATNLKATWPTPKFTHVFNTFMLQFLTEPFQAVQQMHDVLQPGGVLAIGVWGPQIVPYDIFEKACQKFDPGYTILLPFHDPHAWRTTNELSRVFAKLDLEHVHTQYVKMPFPFHGAASYLKFWFDALNPGAQYVIKSYTADIEPVKREIARIVEEEYGGGKDIFMNAALAVGRKKSS